MKLLTKLVLLSAGSLVLSAAGQGSSSEQPWRVRFDIGGIIPENPTLSMMSGPVTGGTKMEMAAGMAMDFAVGYRVTPWLLVEGELGVTYNKVESVGNWTYPNSSLSQMPMMLNVEFCYPRGPLVPFVGLGAGGVFSELSFGNTYYFYNSDSAGSGTDFVPAVQAFAGVRFDFDQYWNIGVVYRFLATAEQNWDVEWWTGNRFQIGVDRVGVHFICLVMTGRF